MSDAAPAIEVRDLHKSYGEYEAVRGVDITVRSGEVFGLLGPNGAGKTTTVEILEGYRERTSGRVSVLGYDPARRSIELRRRIGIVLQSGGIYGHITPREALRHWASFYPRPRDVEEVLALAGLEDKAEEPSRKLSGGQLRRLDLSRAIVAGGLNPDNVAEVAALEPYAVDCASGVESSPGVKDHEKLRSFVNNAKRSR